MKPIRVYCANLPQRKERREHIEKEFKHRPEFFLRLVPAIEHKTNGAEGLYQTFLSILDMERDCNTPYFIFIEDDHKFTATYSFSYLEKSIAVADTMGAEILVGGPTFIHIPLQCTPNLFWVKVFNGCQFMVVFRKVFTKYQEVVENKRRILDVSLSEIFDYTFVMYPTISEQEFFGYSDATPELFKNTDSYLRGLSLQVERRMQILDQLREVVTKSISIV